jgi:hypothetical protein
MSAQELVFKVKELHVLSLACSKCGHGTLFDFKNSDYLERLLSSQCSICNTALANDFQEQLKAYGGCYSCMASREGVEFRVRVSNPATLAAESASDVNDAVSSVLAEVHGAVSKAFAREHELADGMIPLTNFPTT